MSGRDHLLAITRIQRHGFFHQDIDAVAQQVDRDRRMQIIWRGDDRRINLVQYLAVITRNPRDPVLSGEIAPALGRGLHQRRKFHLFYPGDSGKMVYLCHRAATNERQSNSIFQFAPSP